VVWFYVVDKRISVNHSKVVLAGLPTWLSRSLSGIVAWPA